VRLAAVAGTPPPCRSVFFIPIITPTAINSRHCKTEFELFRARKIELGRDDLIFPILYIDVPALEDEAQRRRNNVLEMIQARQYADWTALRWQSADSSEFGKEIGRYCRSIRDALNRPWVSPEERLREAEAKARQQAEDAAQDKGRSNEPRGPRNAEDVVQPRKLRRTPRDAPKVTLKQRLVADAKGRPKESLAAKHEQMRESVWNFFRSDPALLYSKISPEELSLAPAGWLAGALHLESFGSYVSDTGLILFDVLDLDDAILAPCTWDLLHFCVSVLIAADTMLIQMSTARKIAQTLLKSFSRTLAEGETGMELRVEPNSSNIIDTFLRTIDRGDHEKYYEKRIRLDKRKRFQIRLDKDRAAELSKEEKADIVGIFNRVSRNNHVLQGVEVHDAASRWIGIRGLGRPRYILVGEHKANAGKPLLMGIDYIVPSGLRTWVDHPQPDWPNEATKVAAVESRVRPAKSDLAVPIWFKRNSHLLYRLRPESDRLSLDRWSGMPEHISEIVEVMGRIVAWNQLRGANWKGSGTHDQFVAFGASNVWHSERLGLATKMTQEIVINWDEFRALSATGELADI
jgi:uncharacterized protein (DUF2252 family)